jgi:hypothetical protein
MSKRNSLEAKMLRREQRAIRHRDARVDKVQKWIPNTNKYGKLEYLPVMMPAGMFK